MARILIADDRPENRLLVATVLQHAGHTVFEAADGAEALAQAAAHRPDLALIDLSLPGTKGTEVIRALRARPQTASVAIALYTASAVHPALRDFMELYGIEHIVPKPAEPAELLAAVQAALAAGR